MKLGDEMKKGNKLIVTFVHSNYRLISAGTEKFVREYSSLLEKNTYNSLTFFSMAKRKNIRLVGVIYNGLFIGLYQYELISEIISGIMSKYKLVLNSLCIQHLKNHDLEYIKNVIEEFEVPVNVFIHDYYALCINSRMISSDGNSCGFEKPNKEKCLGCQFSSMAIKHFNSTYEFYKSIDDNLNKVIVPSMFVEKILCNTFPFLERKIVVRPHLVFEGRSELKEISGKIKIAYVGAQIEDKGFNEWIKLVEYLTKTHPNDYEFYYFGFGNKKINNVKNIYVAVSDKESKPMECYLKEYGINCALLWSHCEETYSYVYYEMALAGIFVITNLNSGNVSEEVLDKKNGIAFTDLNMVYDWFSKPEKVVESINEYRTSDRFAPKIASENNEMFLPKSCIASKQYNQIPDSNSIWSIVYCIKHMLVNKEKNQSYELLREYFRFKKGI